MANEIYLTRVGMTMTEGVVAEWYIADGEKVAKGQLLYRLETEKVELEVDADDSGVVKHLVEAGVSCEPGDVVGWIYAPDEKIPDVLPKGEKLAGDAMEVAEPAAASSPSAPSPTPSAGAGVASPASPAADIATRGIGGRILASPAARKLAQTRRIPLESIRGTGPGGRIVEADVPESGAGALPASITPTPAERIKASPVAKRRAQDLGVDLALVVGTGPGGRITKSDVEVAATRPAAAAAAPSRAADGRCGQAAFAADLGVGSGRRSTELHGSRREGISQGARHASENEFGDGRDRDRAPRRGPRRDRSRAR
jgi:pyruvate dehydrogenase E2 component (dihydrolipoamide acetyltransferase)